MKWLLALAALAAILFVLALRAADRPAPPPAPASPAKHSVDPARVQSVARDVAQRNRAQRTQAAAFEADGWSLVATAAPDARLMRYDPALLDAREDELRTQLASTVATPADAARIAAIVRRARPGGTRVAAVEALGRIDGAEGQHALVGLLLDGSLPESDDARQLIVPLLRPTALDDPFALELARLMDAPQLTAVEKKQLAFTLSLVGLRDGMQLPSDALAALSPAARERLAAMTTLAKGETP